MKKLLILLLVIVSSVHIGAQYYNPYYNPYVSNQGLQNAYEMGKRMRERMHAQQEANDKRSPNACVKRIIEAISNRNFNLAEEWAHNLVNIDKKSGYSYMGLISSLQGNLYDAKAYYQRAIKAGNINCQDALDSLEENGLPTEEQINNCVQNCKNIKMQAEVMAYQITNNIWGNMGGSNSLGNSNRRECPSCRGSKKGTDQIIYRPDYTGNQANEYCPTCNKWTSPHSHHISNCSVCYGRGYIE